MKTVFHSNRRLLAWLLACGLLLHVVGVPGPTKAHAADEFDDLRNKLVAQLIGSDYSTSDPDVAARIASSDVSVNTIWSSMNKSPGRTDLWSSITAPKDKVHRSLNNLKAMTAAYKTNGSSYFGNSSLRTDIIDGIDFIYNNWYSNYIARQSDNWWNLEVSAARSLSEMTAMLYDDLSSAQRANYVATVEHFVPTPKGFTGDYVAANRIWKANIVMMSGINGKNSTRIHLAKDALSKLFDPVASGDGVYIDGSFLQHSWYPYAGGYGLSMLGDLSNILYVLDGSTWSVTDPDLANVYNWVYTTYEPILYEGVLMDAYRGRENSRHMIQDKDAGNRLIATIANMARFAPPSHASSFKSMVKRWVQADQSGTLYANMSITDITNVKSIMNDSGVAPREELIKHIQYPNQDRFVHLRPGWAFTASMYSNKTKNYETNQNASTLIGENLRGWYTSDGMTYLYNNNDPKQYSDHYWPTVNPYRMAGTTVDTQTRTNGSGVSKPWDNKITWAGGTDLDNEYGIAGFYLNTELSTLKAKKSWFMFDDEVVALGSDIDSTDNRTIETIVDNRKLNAAGNNELIVNNSTKSGNLGWSETMTGVNWMNLEGTGGYYFPTAATIKGKRYARTGTWADINTAYPETTPRAHNYMELWQDHGTNPNNATYDYVLLPNKSASATEAYAANPNIQILANTTYAHAVSETTLGIKGYHFWNDGTSTVGEMSVNKKASVMTKESGNTFDISISDPTQANTGTIQVEIAKSAAGLVSYDAGITVTQLSPTIKFNVNVNNANGSSFKAKFQLPDINSSFDGDAIGSAPAGWAVEELGGTVSVVADPSSSDRSVRLNQTTAASNLDTGISRTFAATTGSTSFEANVKLDPLSSWGGFYVYDSSNNIAVSLAFDKGMLKANIGGSWTNVQAYSPGTWYKVRIAANPATDQFDLYINDVPKLSAQPFRTAVSNLSKVRFYTVNAIGTMTVNNAKVYANVPVPTPVPRPVSPTVPAAPIVTNTEEGTAALGNVPSGWTATTNGRGTITVQPYFNSGNWFKQSIQFDKQLAGYGMYLTRDFAAQSGIIKSAAYMTPTSTGTNWRIIMSSGSTEAVKITFASDGNIKYNDTATVMPYRANTPYLVEIKINTVTDTFDLYIDSLLKASNAPLKTAVTSIDKMQFSALSSDLGTLYIDHILVYNYDYQN